LQNKSIDAGDIGVDKKNFLGRGKIGNIVATDANSTMHSSHLKNEILYRSLKPSIQQIIGSKKRNSKHMIQSSAPKFSP
jgi:hypothetical protein